MVHRQLPSDKGMEEYLASGELLGFHEVKHVETVRYDAAVSFQAFRHRLAVADHDMNKAHLFPTVNKVTYEAFFNWGNTFCLHI
jgi:hypothetical protein